MEVNTYAYMQFHLIKPFVLGTLALTQQLHNSTLLETSNGSVSSADQMNFAASSNSCSALVPSYSQQSPFGSNAAPTVQNNPNLQVIQVKKLACKNKS